MTVKKNYIQERDPERKKHKRVDRNHRHDKRLDNALRAGDVLTIAELEESELYYEDDDTPEYHLD